MTIFNRLKLKEQQFKVGWPLLMALVLASILVSPRPIFNTDRLALDAASYISHAFTIGLDFDLDYSNEPVDQAGFFNTETGLPSHPIGPGILAAPFVAIFSIVDRLADSPVINDHENYSYSWSKFGFFFSGLFYFLLGLWLYCDLARKITGTFKSWWVLTAGLGCGVAYYAFQDGYLGHQFEFFSVALIVWSVAKVWRNVDDNIPRKYGFIFLAIIGVTLSHLVRPANLNVLILPIITTAALLLDGQQQVSLNRMKRLLLTSIVVGLIAATLLAIIYTILYDTPFPLPSDMYGTTRGDVSDVSAVKEEGLSSSLPVIQKVIHNIPYIFPILFSSEFGLLYTSTIIFVGIIAIFTFLAFRANKSKFLSIGLILLLFVYLGIPFAVVLYWESTASAYGWRYLFSLIPIGFLGVYIAWSQLETFRRNKLKKILIVLLLLFSSFGILGQAFWGTSDRLHFQEGKNIFGRVHGNKDCCSGIGYTTKLTQDLIEPSAWAAMAAHRFPGFVGAKILEASGADIQMIGKNFGMPTEKLEVGLMRYQDASPVATIQVVIIFLVTALTLWKLALWKVSESTLEHKRPGLAEP